MTRPHSNPGWPELTEWDETRDALHLWTQIVGKVRLKLEPFVNQWWNVTLYVSARGLTTSLMHDGELGVEMEFDFLADRLTVRTSEGLERHVRLESRSVASFYEETMAALEDLGVHVRIHAVPNELPVAIPFGQDRRVRPYDADAARRFWRALGDAHRVMSRFRSRFRGKVSPVHYFWGAADLAVTRFSGGSAPEHPGGVPNCPDWVQRLAYSQEVSSCGFWPGGSAEGSFYAYAYPEPEGFSRWPVTPTAASYDPELREFVLPYRDVRTADDPDAMLFGFFESTYEAAAELLGWDRAVLEITET